MSREAIEEIEMNIKEAREIVEMGNSLERLRHNADFQKVVLKQFMEREAIRLVHLKNDANMQDAESQASILKQMDGIGSLTHFFNGVFHQSNLARKAIESDEETRDEMLAEGLEE